MAGDGSKEAASMAGVVEGRLLLSCMNVQCDWREAASSKYVTWPYWNETGILYAQNTCTCIYFYSQRRKILGFMQETRYIHTHKTASQNLCDNHVVTLRMLRLMYDNHRVTQCRNTLPLNAPTY